MDRIAQWIEEESPAWMGDEEERAFREYADYIGGLEYAIESFEEAYAGKWQSERDFAEQLADDLGIVDHNTEAGRYFDWDAWTRDLFMCDYFQTEGGYVFRSI